MNKNHIPSPGQPIQAGRPSNIGHGGVSATTPLVFRARATTNLSHVDLEALMRPGHGEMLARLDWEAKVNGDLASMRLLAGAHLRSATQVHAGVGRERWALQLAVSHTDGLAVTTVGDLTAWVARVREGLMLARIESMDFGRRRAGSLDNGFARAEARLDRIAANVALAVNGQLWKTADLIRDISFAGDLHLCDALTRAFFEGGDKAWAKITMAAHVRHRHQQPGAALEILDETLSTTCNPAALNSKSGSLCDLGSRSVDGQPYFTAAMEATLISLAVAPNIYAARTGSRSFKLGGRPDLQDHCLEMWGAYNSGTVPEGFGNLESFFSHKATMVLVAANRRDLAELQLRHQWTPQMWAEATRVHADTTAGIAVGA